MYLRKYNSVKIMRAYNGREAVEACQNCKDIALVLMDIKMPLMTGIQATKEIKTFRPNLPIMAITAYAVSGDEFKLRKEGFDEYLPKPLQKNELYRKINFFMNSSS
jgi:CheY-like chemotaxis protein